MSKQDGNGSTAIVKASKYAIVTQHERALKVLKTNIGPGGITERDLTLITIPTGGGTQWQTQTLKGEEHVDALYGVPIMFKDVRLHWEKSYEETGGGEPPTCKTINDEASVGVGTPGGNCAVCPMNQWNEDSPTGRKRCALQRALFVCGPEDYLPFVFVLPVMSRIECVKYFVRLGSKGINHFGTVLKYTLATATNKTGIKYSKVQFELEEQLSPDVADQMQIVSEGMRQVLGGFSIAETVRKQESTYGNEATGQSCRHTET